MDQDKRLPERAIESKTVPIISNHDFYFLGCAGSSERAMSLTLGLLVHLPHLRVLDREDDEPFFVVPKQNFFLSLLQRRKSRLFKTRVVCQMLGGSDYCRVDYGLVFGAASAAATILAAVGGSFSTTLR